MTIFNSILVGVFCLALVFFVLMVLYGMVMLLSGILRVKKAGKAVDNEGGRTPAEVGVAGETAGTGAPAEVGVTGVPAETGVAGRLAGTGDTGRFVATGTGKEVRESTVVYGSLGEVVLRNVDERTAAIIMAIVSEESGIPLSELVFKSIEAVY